MEKIFEWILKHKIFIISVFTISVIICALLKPQVKVDYDMNDYLPEDSPSTQAISVMEDEFGGGIPNARVMISNVTIPEALQYKEKLSEIEGVSDVIWLDDSINLEEALETQDESVVETYYKDKTALYVVTIEGDKRVDAVNAIRNLIGNDNAMTGAAVSTAVATTSTVDELGRLMVIVLPLILLILIVTTTSWIEPFIMLASIGVAILLNEGSNLIFGTISFVTNGSGSILQLAVSLDFSVFLLHSYIEQKDSESSAKEAMKKALCKSFGTIFSCGLTLIIGFLALTIMRFKIGPDLGIALAKGMCLSLLTVFTFYPVLMVSMDKWIEKTRHRPFLPNFDKFGKFVCKIMFPLVILFAILVVPSYLAREKNDFYYGAEHIFNSSTQLGKDTENIDTVFGKSNNIVVMVPRGDTTKEMKLNDSLQAIPEVSDIISYVNNVGAQIPESYLDENTLKKLESDNYSRMVLTVKTNYEGQQAFDTVEAIRNVAEQYYPGKWYLAGESVSTYDLKDTITADDVRVNLIAVAAIFIVILLVFRSVSIPVILVLAIETAIWINVSMPYFMNKTVFYISYLIISSVQLGATVDYAILFAHRYLDFRKEYVKKLAVQKTIAVVTIPILTSGTVLTITGYLLGYMTTHGILKQLGVLLGAGTILSMGVVFLVLPGLLYLVDGVIEKTTKGVKFVHKEKEYENR
jgi:predicted RND superfamily exporter protein